MANFTSFDQFTASTVGQQIGNGTSKDYISLLWEHLGSVYYTANPSSPSPTTAGVKYGWLNTDARTANTVTHLTQVESLADVKKGDVIILSSRANGFAGFANSDYNGTNTLPLYSQNYVDPRVTLDDVPMTDFLGGWRYDAWNVTPPEPPTPTPVSEKRKKFKWVLYSRKLREKRRGL